VCNVNGAYQVILDVCNMKIFGMVINIENKVICMKDDPIL